MVVVRTVNKLRGRPKDERVAVAGGIALAVVAILLVGWVAFFLHGIGSGQVVEVINQLSTTQARSQVPQTASASPATSQWETSSATTSDQTVPSSSDQPPVPTIVQ